VEASHQPEQPTVEQAQQAMEVGGAAASAAAAAPTAEEAQAAAAKAARAKADEVKLELTDEHIERISDGVVKAMESRGAFDAPLEPVQPSPAPEGEEPVQPPPPEPAPEAPPRKRSIAQRFMGE